MLLKTGGKLYLPDELDLPGLYTNLQAGLEEAHYRAMG